jgi:prevent-host-death family protein
MQQISLTEAKRKLFRIIAAGDEVVITRYGKPAARLVPLRTTAAKRVPGSARAQFKVPKEFFEPLPNDILDSF